MEEQNKNNGVMIGAGVLIVLTLGYGFWKYAKKEEVASTVTPKEQAVNNSMFAYRDGTHTSNGSYFSPGGEEQIEVSITLKDDVVSDVSVTPLSTRPISIKMQGIFTANYKPLVIGKSINDVVLDKVSGSSLTPKGWNDAVAKIKISAKL
ncbi:MAG: hypothetical protein EXS47_00970 [Candidatus Zambryskibacteria bacterium]|nr:hypothetical protein [Candidatus Zambryskibacteria bacterium]